MITDEMVHAAQRWLHSTTGCVVLTDTAARGMLTAAQAVNTESKALREAARGALETLRQLQGLCTDADDGCLEAITIWTPEAITALSEALGDEL